MKILIFLSFILFFIFNLENVVSGNIIDEKNSDDSYDDSLTKDNPKKDNSKKYNSKNWWHEQSEGILFL